MSSHPFDPSRERLIAVDLLRSLAIFIVVAGHSKTGLSFPESPWVQYIWAQIAGSSVIGVFVFFVISGFLITRLIDRSPGGLLHPDYGWFYIRRAGRILPLMVLVFFIGIAMYFSIHEISNRAAYCFKGPGAPYGAWFWASIPTFHFNWFLIAHPTQDFPRHWGILWSLAVEEQFYLIYPFLLRRIGTIGNLKIFLWATMAFALISNATTSAWRPADHALNHFSSFYGFGFIALGAIVYLANKEHPKIAGSALKASLSVLLGLGLFIVLLFKGGSIPAIAFTILLGAAVSMALLGLLQGGWREHLIVRWAAEPGRLSYGLYLWHIALLYFTAPYIKNLPWSIAFSIYVVATFGWAFLSYRFYELPLNRAIRSWLLKGRAGS
jgi:peptidoglycan/LPS O-acetylase OafA/YrhL